MQNELKTQEKLSQHDQLIKVREETIEKINKANNEPFEWLNENSRKFLAAGYLQGDQTPEMRIREIAKRAEDILQMPGFADKFYHYMSEGFYSLASPVWSNFGNKSGLPISCFGSHIDDDIGNILYLSLIHI